MTKLKKGDVIVIEGRRWFEKTNGNTYHSVSVSVNNDFEDSNPFCYGYGNQYEQTAFSLLKKAYELEDNMPFWHLKDKGIIVRSYVSDVARKKDL
jgi:hypothetical protein